MSVTIWQSLAARADDMRRNAFQGIDTLPDWEKVRAERRREFLHGLGLDPMPERCDPRVVECGEFKAAGYRARKIGFMIMPDCWTSATVYYPDPQPAGRLPGVLYVCGHGKTGTYHYQYHPVLWARRGYVCLIVDTIMQHDNPGAHASFLMNRQDLWLSLGYAAGGGELLNSIRALDVLAEDPAVDPDRLGVTGISGGGALSFYTAVADERIKAVATLCGISTPYDAIANHRLYNHCDCMYPYHLYGRDTCEYAALIAPRAALFCFGDHDALFCARETTALVERTRKIYDLYGQGERCRLLAHACGHETHPEFNRATQEWFDAHVARAPHPVLEKFQTEVTEQTADIFHGTPPQPNLLHLLPELVAQRGVLPLPQAADDWPRIRQQALQKLPRAMAGYDVVPFRRIDHWCSKGVARSRMHACVGGVDVWMETVRPEQGDPRLVLGMAGGAELTRHAYANMATAFDGTRIACAALEPRLSGCNYAGREPAPFPAGSRLRGAGSQLMRAMAIMGETPVSMLLHDLRLAVDYLLGLAEFSGHKLCLFGIGETAVAALYCAISDERVAGAVLEDLPVAHSDGVPLPGILRTMDIPQAAGLMAPRPLVLVSAGTGNWTWPTRAYERAGQPGNFVMAPDRRAAFAQVWDKI